MVDGQWTLMRALWVSAAEPRVLFRGSRSSRLGSKAKARGGGPLVSGTVGYGTTAQPGPLGLFPDDADRGPWTVAP